MLDLENETAQKTGEMDSKGNKGDLNKKEKEEKKKKKLQKEDSEEDNTNEEEDAEEDSTSEEKDEEVVEMSSEDESDESDEEESDGENSPKNNKNKKRSQKGMEEVWEQSLANKKEKRVTIKKDKRKEWQKNVRQMRKEINFFLKKLENSSEHMLATLNVNIKLGETTYQSTLSSSGGIEDTGTAIELGTYRNSEGSVKVRYRLFGTEEWTELSLNDLRSIKRIKKKIMKNLRGIPIKLFMKQPSGLFHYLEKEEKDKTLSQWMICHGCVSRESPVTFRIHLGSSQRSKRKTKKYEWSFGGVIGKTELADVEHKSPETVLKKIYDETSILRNKFHPKKWGFEAGICMEVSCDEGENLPVRHPECSLFIIQESNRLEKLLSRQWDESCERRYWEHFSRVIGREYGETFTGTYFEHAFLKHLNGEFPVFKFFEGSVPMLKANTILEKGKITMEIYIDPECFNAPNFHTEWNSSLEKAFASNRYAGLFEQIKTLRIVSTGQAEGGAENKEEENKAPTHPSEQYALQMNLNPRCLFNEVLIDMMGERVSHQSHSAQPLFSLSSQSLLSNKSKKSFSLIEIDMNLGYLPKAVSQLDDEDKKNLEENIFSCVKTRSLFRRFSLGEWGSFIKEKLLSENQKDRDCLIQQLKTIKEGNQTHPTMNQGSPNNKSLEMYNHIMKNNMVERIEEILGWDTFRWNKQVTKHVNRSVSNKTNPILAN